MKKQSKSDRAKREYKIYRVVTKDGVTVREFDTVEEATAYVRRYPVFTIKIIDIE